MVAHRTDNDVKNRWNCRLKSLAGGVGPGEGSRPDASGAGDTAESLDGASDSGDDSDARAVRDGAGGRGGRGTAPGGCVVPSGRENTAPVAVRAGAGTPGAETVAPRRGGDPRACDGGGAAVGVKSGGRGGVALTAAAPTRSVGPPTARCGDRGVLSS
jgi:hypothetical protein